MLHRLRILPTFDSSHLFLGDPYLFIMCKGSLTNELVFKCMLKNGDEHEVYIFRQLHRDLSPEFDSPAYLLLFCPSYLLLTVLNTFLKICKNADPQLLKKASWTRQTFSLSSHRTHHTEQSARNSAPTLSTQMLLPALLDFKNNCTWGRQKTWQAFLYTLRRNGMVWRNVFWQCM